MDLVAPASGRLSRGRPRPRIPEALVTLVIYVEITDVGRVEA